MVFGVEPLIALLAPYDHDGAVVVAAFVQENGMENKIFWAIEPFQRGGNVLADQNLKVVGGLGVPDDFVILTPDHARHQWSLGAVQ